MEEIFERDVDLIVDREFRNPVLRETFDRTRTVVKNETRKNLIDVIQAAEEIKDFVFGMDLDSYKDNPVTRRVIERDFEIIGEALNRI